MVNIEKYWRFDVEGFIKDYPENKTLLQEKREALEELSETKAMRYDSAAGGGTPGDGTASAAEKIIKIKEEIEVYNHFVTTYEKAHNELTDEEKFIIRHFFHEPGMKSSKVRFLSNELGYEVAEVYRRRGRAINHFRELLHV